MDCRIKVRTTAMGFAKRLTQRTIRRPTTGKSPARFIGPLVKPLRKNISVFQK
jgi:hypothetical protein